MVKMIWTPILSDHNDTICTKQWLRKCQITNPLSNQISWDTNHTTPFQFQNNLLETTYVNTCQCNITVTNTRLSLARPTLFVHCPAHRRLQANTSRRIKRSSGWYHPRRYRLQLFRTATAGCACNPRNARLYTCALTWILTETVFPLTWSESRPWPWRWRANNKLGQNRVSLKGLYGWGVNSTVTKHWDHFVW